MSITVFEKTLFFYCFLLI